MKNSKRFGDRITKEHQEVFDMAERKESAHSKWRCEHHIVFAPKNHRKEIDGNYAQVRRNTYLHMNMIWTRLCFSYFHFLLFA